MIVCKVCGYADDRDDYTMKCPFGHKDWEDWYLHELKEINPDPTFINAMMALKENDPIEYQIKIKQLGIAKNPSEKAEREPDNRPKCPTCGSHSIEKISVSKKAFGGAMFGLFSSDVRNTMHCRCCGAKW